MIFVLWIQVDLNALVREPTKINTTTRVTTYDYLICLAGAKTYFPIEPPAKRRYMEIVGSTTVLLNLNNSECGEPISVYVVLVRMYGRFLIPATPCLSTITLGCAFSKECRLRST